MRFKQFLREQIFVHATFIVEVSTSLVLSPTQWKPLEKKLEEFPKSSFVSIDRESIEVEFRDLIQQELQSDHLDGIEEGVISEIEYYLSELSHHYGQECEIEHSNTRILCDGGLPAFPISCNRTIVVQCKENTVISGISKLISGCEAFELTDVDRLKPQGVLDLLRLPKDVQYLEFGWAGSKPGWTDTVYKHFDDRDLLECKEELMTNGFKEWAKL